MFTMLHAVSTVLLQMALFCSPHTRLVPERLKSLLLKADWQEEGRDSCSVLSPFLIPLLAACSNVAVV